MSNYCFLCITTYNDIEVNQNLIDTPTKSNVFQCPKCCAVHTNINLINTNNYNDLCPVCKKPCTEKILSDFHADDWRCSDCTIGHPTEIRGNYKNVLPKKFRSNYKKLFVRIEDLISNNDPYKKHHKTMLL